MCEQSALVRANNYYRKITGRFSTFLALQLLNAATCSHYFRSSSFALSITIRVSDGLSVGVFSRTFCCCFSVCLYVFCIFIADHCAHSITFQTQQMNSRNGNRNTMCVCACVFAYKEIWKNQTLPIPHQFSFTVFLVLSVCVFRGVPLLQIIVAGYVLLCHPFQLGTKIIII